MYGLLEKFNYKMAAISGRGIRMGAVIDDGDTVTGSTTASAADDELLVFGYSCKLFRDDEKAAYIDRGQHLIPWMGDASHMIDRYDGRGYIHDLHEYEPVVGHDPWQELSDEERHLESVCDEERYAALKGDPAQNDLYHEEELKRLKAALADDGVYNQVGFSYDDTGQSTAPTEGQTTLPANTKDNENDRSPGEVFVPAKDLSVPPTLQVPASVKSNAIIERTALFVVRQGAQMEILIKAKQAANPHFGFLSFDHALNPYYKHVVHMVKQGKYTPKPTTEDNDGSEEDDDDDDGGHYLHPSLMPAKEEALMVPKLNYARTGDDPYSLLVSRLKDKVGIDAEMNRLQSTTADIVLPEAPAPPPPPPPPPPPGCEPVTLPSGTDEPVINFGGLLPPPDVLPIIDKMASYVAKNGDHFEAVVRSKNLDARFGFLTSGHPHHAYYQFKRRQFAKDVSSVNKDSASAQAVIEDDSSQDSELKAGASAVSFSIKMKEGGGGSGGSSGERRRTFTDTIDGNVLTLITKKLEQPPAKEPTEDELRLKAKLIEARLAEQRIRDKLAAAARERLAQASREKQLQLERKRKAALFLTMLRRERGSSGGGGDDDDDAESSSLIGPRLPTTVEMTQMIMREDSPPLLALVAAQVESKSSKASSSAAVAASNSKKEEPEDAVGRNRRSRTPPTSSSATRSRRRSHSRSERRHRRSRSRSDSKERRRRRHRRERRSRSPRPSTKDDRRRGGGSSSNVHKGKTPPATQHSSASSSSAAAAVAAATAASRRRAATIPSPHRRGYSRRRGSSRPRDSRSHRRHRDRRHRTRSRSRSSKRVTEGRRRRSRRKSSTSSSSSSSSSSAAAGASASSSTSASKCRSPRSASSRSSSVVSLSAASSSGGSARKSPKRRRSSESTKSKKESSKGSSPSTPKSKRRR